MNIITNTVIFTLAALSAFGADQKLNFHVEFPFYVSSTQMPAGSYTLEVVKAGQPGLYLRNTDSGKMAFLSLPIHRIAKPAEQKPTVTFACTNTRCQVQEVANLRPGKVESRLSQRVAARMVAVALTRLRPGGE